MKVLAFKEVELRNSAVLIRSASRSCMLMISPSGYGEHRLNVTFSGEYNDVAEVSTSLGSKREILFLALTTLETR